MLRILEVNEDALQRSAENRGGQPLIGMFKHHPRIKTDDGVVNDKRPSCSAEIVVGPETFRLVRDRVLDFKPYDFEIGLDVIFPKGSVEKGLFRRAVTWDGKDQLPISSAVVVWVKEDWRVDVRRKQRLGPPKAPEYVGPREHVELLSVLRRIEVGLKAVLKPLWIIAILIAALAWWFVHR